MRIECSVWTNGRNAWGIRVLGGTSVRLQHFKRECSPVTVEIDGGAFEFSVNKKSFWTKTCGEMIGVPIRDWKKRHGLKSGDHAWLAVVEPYKRFRLELPDER